MTNGNDLKSFKKPKNKINRSDLENVKQIDFSFRKINKLLFGSKAWYQNKITKSDTECADKTNKALISNAIGNL